MDQSVEVCDLGRPCTLRPCMPLASPLRSRGLGGGSSRCDLVSVGVGVPDDVMGFVMGFAERALLAMSAELKLAQIQFFGGLFVSAWGCWGAGSGFGWRRVLLWALFFLACMLNQPREVP